MINCYHYFSCACMASLSRITHNSLHKNTFKYATIESVYHQIFTITYGHRAMTSTMKMILCTDLKSTIQVAHPEPTALSSHCCIQCVQDGHDIHVIQKKLKTNFWISVCCECALPISTQFAFAILSCGKSFVLDHVPHSFAH